MPIAHIALKDGTTDAYRQAIMDGLYQAMREDLAVPEDDQFMVVTEHSDANFRVGNAFGVTRSDAVVYIRIVLFDNRTVDQKKAFYAKAAALLGDTPGVAPNDVFINLVESRAENWSVGHGRATFLEPGSGHPALT